MAKAELTIDWEKWGPPIEGFSCVEQKWAAAEEIGALLEAMTRQERIAYYDDANTRFKKRLTANAPTGADSPK